MSSFVSLLREDFDVIDDIAAYAHDVFSVSYSIQPGLNSMSGVPLHYAAGCEQTSIRPELKCCVKDSQPKDAVP